MTANTKLSAVSALFLLLFTLACSNGHKRCSKVALHAWCLANLTQDMARVHFECERDFAFHERRCRVDEQGDYCGSFVDNLDDIELASDACLDQGTMSCSNTCRQRLQVLRDGIGCCINEILNTTLGPTNHQRLFEYSLWKMCGINPITEKCPPSRLTKFPKHKITRNCSFHEFFQRRYQVQCRNSTVKFLADDYNAHGCQQVSADLYNTCSITEEGAWCIEKHVANLTSNLMLAKLARSYCSSNGPCTAECRTALQGIRSNLGCCINNLFNNTYMQLIYTETVFSSVLAHYEVWKGCGVTHPCSCQVKTYSGTRSAKFTWTVVTFFLFLAFLLKYW